MSCPWRTGNLLSAFDDGDDCLQKCSAQHGYCKDGKCVCDPGWDGDDCKAATCPEMCSVGINGMANGDCVDGRCICQVRAPRTNGANAPHSIEALCSTQFSSAEAQFSSMWRSRAPRLDPRTMRNGDHQTRRSDAHGPLWDRLESSGSVYIWSATT